MAEMGFTEATITITNEWEEENARLGLIKHEDVHAVAVTAMVDTGTTALIISPKIKEDLGLSVTETRTARLANGLYQTVDVTAAVTIRFQGRTSVCRALVVPNAHTLLGCIPLEEMRLKVNPVSKKLELITGEEDVIDMIDMMLI
jgi:clan AA aspartic protease